MGLVVTIIKGNVGAAISRVEETVSSRGGVFIDTSTPAIREVGLVTISKKVGSTINEREARLVITSKLVEVEDTRGVETGLLMGSSRDSIYSITGIVEGTDSASVITIELSVDEGRCWIMM